MTQPNKPNTSQSPATPATQYRSALSKYTETYTNMLVEQAKSVQIQYTEYQKTCVANMIAKMQEVIVKEGLTFKDVDPNNLTNTLQTVAMLQLNTAATPRECFITLRKVKVKVPTGEKDNYGNTKFKDEYIRQFEFGIEGDGNDAILRRYGVNVQTVHQAWLVREGDEFEFPSFNGLELTPPKWKPKSYSNKVNRVVYPVTLNTGVTEYHIAERESVTKNLLAHISNNMMNETFGIGGLKSRYDANETQLEQIEKKKQDLMDLIVNKNLDGILSTVEVRKWISPSWLSPHSREDMIIRKMRNNAVKKIPKDFQNAFVALQYEKTYEDYDQYRQPKNYVDAEDKLEGEYEAQANQQPLTTNVDIEPTTGEVQQTSQPVNTQPSQPVQQPTPTSSSTRAKASF